MGWNPWNCFGVGRTGSCKLPLPWTPGYPACKTVSCGACHNFNESVILEVAHAMASSPLKKAGYEFINLDCGYSTKRRDKGGNLVVNRTRFPHGMVWLGEQIHALGLKFGMYSGQGTQQCCSKIDPRSDDGSEGHWDQDAKLFASWKIDFLKHDGCAGPRSSTPAMRDALNRTGRHIVYSINNGVYANNTQAANLWRTTPDISNTYGSMLDRAMVNNNRSAVAGGARPGGFNDPDMMEIGNFFTDLADAEGRTNFALWSLMKAPLMLGNDLTNMTAATMATVTNTLAIAVNKDPLAEQGVLRVNTCYDGCVKDAETNVRTCNACGYQVWSGRLAKGAIAVVLANLDETKTVSIKLAASMLPRGDANVNAFEQAKWTIRNVFDKKDYAADGLPFSAKVKPHDVAFLVLTPAATAAKQH